MLFVPSSVRADGRIFFKDLTDIVDAEFSGLDVGLPHTIPAPLERSGETATVFFIAPHGVLKPGASAFGKVEFNGLVADSLQILEPGIGSLSDRITVRNIPLTDGGVSFNILAVTFESSDSLSDTPIDRSRPFLFEDGTEQLAGTITWEFVDSTEKVFINFQSDVDEFIPVPEPSTYGLLGGLALIGVAMARRKKAFVGRGC